MTVSSQTDELAERVEAELDSVVTSRDMPLYRMMSYHMGWHDQHGDSNTPMRKQRTHGVLCLLACQALGGDPDLALPTAAAVELVDSFCEIHDDVQGGKPKRDDRDAVWWVWGPAQAINAGDGMHALARLALFRLLERGISSEKTFQAVQLLDQASLQTCEGRFLDLEAQERIDMGVDSYLEMVARKTGSLLSCAMELGGLVASDDESARAALAACGAGLGVAIQLRNDLDELWPDEDKDSVPSPEVMNKKKLLPVVYALENASAGQKRRLGDIYFKRVLQPEDVSKVREIVEDLGARQHCEALVQTYRSEGLSALDVPAVLEEGRADIEGFIAALIDR